MNMYLQAAWSFLGTATALALALAILKYLVPRFIEHKLGLVLQRSQHELDATIKRLEVDLGRVSDVLSRRNEREFAVIERAWELMIRTVGSAQTNFLWAEDLIDLVNLEEADAVQLIDGTTFSAEEKSLLRSMRGEQRQKLYATVVHHYRTRQVEAAWHEFNNCLSAKQIFMTPSIYAMFPSIAHELSDHTRPSRRPGSNWATPFPTN